MRRLATVTTVALALVLTGCSTTAPQPTAPLTNDTQDENAECLTVGDAQATAISEGVEDGITLTDWTALPAKTGPGAWFIKATANGPGIENEPFVFFTAGDPENFTGGSILAADNVTAEFVEWPMQEGAMTDDAFDAVQDCTR